MQLTNFCKTYLRAQGVLILPPRRVVSGAVREREPEVVAPVPDYPHGDPS